jgi:hypothetical protein
MLPVEICVLKDVYILLPLGKLSQTIKVDKAERAVFKALYPIPVENKSLKHGENGLMFLSQQ